MLNVPVEQQRCPGVFQEDGLRRVLQEMEALYEQNQADV